jgi:hypothetical protein
MPRLIDAVKADATLGRRDHRRDEDRLRDPYTEAAEF